MMKNLLIVIFVFVSLASRSTRFTFAQTTGLPSAKTNLSPTTMPEISISWNSPMSSTDTSAILTSSIISSQDESDTIKETSYVPDQMAENSLHT